MSCQKLYYDNSYLVEFFATVTECIKDSDRFAVVLDKTAFYPEGGGQPSDTGVFVVDSAEIKVLETREKQGEIYHYTSSFIKIGSVVKGVIDFDRRFDFMQQHTGEHIFSGLVHKHFGYDNVGFHLSCTDMYVDFPHPLTKAEIDNLTALANDIILKNQPVTTSYPQDIELLDYRSKKAIEGKIRIVTAGDADVCACCGTHTKTTGEVSMLAVLDWSNYKGGTRISLACGKRLFADYMKKNDTCFAISRLLSAKVGEVLSAVQNKVVENESLKQELASLKMDLYKQWVLNVDAGKLGCFSKDNLTPGELQKVAQLINLKCDIACVWSLQIDGTTKICVISKAFDSNLIGKALCEKLNGKGGGKNGIFQATVLISADICTIVESVV